jgi:hypothetical protein
LSEVGTREPSSATTPSAKAMSVAAGVAPVEGREDEGRDQHAARRRDPRQDAAPPGRELSVQDLALDLEADEQKEHGHQAVVDPVLDAERAEIRVQPGEIGRRQGRVRDGKRQRGCGHQHQSAGG